MVFPGTPAFKTEALAPGLVVGLYGGSFDPPHAAHAHVARTAMKRLGLDRVWWLPSPGNPFKLHRPAPLDDRLALIACIAPQPRMVASAFEAGLGTNRTIGLIRALQRRHPQVRFIWLMGADGLGDLHRWTDWEEIARRVPICVIARPGGALRARLAPAARRLQQWRVSSSQAKALRAGPPRWTYLTERLHPHASRALRNPS